jgi:hypothetical protein
MGNTFMVRLAGDPERNTENTSIQIPASGKFESVPVEAKVFNNADVIEARGRGWVLVREIVHAYLTGNPEPAKEEEKPDTIEEKRGEPLPAGSKAELVIWIREKGLASQFDLRKGLPSLIEDVTNYLSAANG